MRRLLVLRHAESGWGAAAGGDRARPLTSRGELEARQLGRLLARGSSAAQVVMTSPAERARATSDLVVEAAGWKSSIEIRDEFYGGDGETVLAMLREIDASVETALVVGHEPVWSGLVTGLCGGGAVRFPPAALACLASERVSWAELGWGEMELRWLVTPDLLAGWGGDASS